MSLLGHVAGLVRVADAVDEGDRMSSALTAFYMGMAIGSGDPASGRRLLAQMEREMAETRGLPPERIETELRAGARSIAAYLDHTVEERA